MGLEIKSLRKGYGLSYPILMNMDFSIEEGSIVGVLGGNGIGKSTLLRSIAQLEPIQGGVVLWNGRQIKKDDVSFIELSGEYYKHKTVQTILNEFKLLSESFDAEKTISLLQNVNIKLEQKVQAMSTGTQQKFEIALTLGEKAALYLFDEPFSNVDYASRTDIKQMLQMHTDDKSTLVLTTNILEDMDTLLTDVVIINKQHVASTYNLEKLREASQQSLKKIYLEETS